jgi:predicted dehydrogenase
VVGRLDDLWARAGEHDLVVVASPSGTHVEVALAALAHRLAVVVDKPLATTAADGRRVADAARATDRLLTVFHNRRWDSDQLTLRRLVEAGELGTVFRHESRFERWRPARAVGSWRDELPPEQGGGVLTDLGPHLVDQALELFGPVERVYAEVHAHRGGFADDEAFLALAHASGVRSHLSLGLVFGAPGPRRRVVGELGTFVVDELDGQEDALRTGARPGEPGFGVEPFERNGRLVMGSDVRTVPSEPGRWSAFYAGVVGALRGVGPAPVDPADAVAGLAVIDAARASAARGSVEVPVG